MASRRRLGQRSGFAFVPVHHHRPDPPGPRGPRRAGHTHRQQLGGREKCFQRLGRPAVMHRPGQRQMTRRGDKLAASGFRAPRKRRFDTDFASSVQILAPPPRQVTHYGGRKMSVRLKGEFDKGLRDLSSSLTPLQHKLMLERASAQKGAPAQLDDFAVLFVAVAILANCMSLMANEVRDD